MSKIINKRKGKYKNLEIDETDPFTKKGGIGKGGGSSKRNIAYKIKKILQTFKIKIISQNDYVFNK